MANILFALPTLSDGATVTCDQSVASTMPLTNLWTSSPVEATRILATSCAITVDLGSAASIRAVLLLTNNVRDTATWRVSWGSSEGELTGSPGPAGSTGWFSITDPLSLGLIAAVTARWWLIEISDTGNPDGFLDLARLYISTAWVPVENVTDWRLTWEDLSVQRDTRGGQIAVARRQRRRRVRFDLQYQHEPDTWDGAYEMLRSRGRSDDLIVILDPGNGDRVQQQAVYGLLTELPSLNHAVPATDPDDARWSVVSFELCELIR